MQCKGDLLFTTTAETWIDMRTHFPRVRRCVFSPPPSDRMCKKKAEGKHSHQLTPFQDGNRKEIFHLSISVRECVCESGSESEREGILTQLCLPMLFNPDRSCGLPALCLHCIVQYKCVILAWLLPPPPQGDERHNCVERQERDS